MAFRTHYGEDGFDTIELLGPPDQTAEFTRDLVDEACAIGVFMTRAANTITLHCSNGEWTYRLTGYDSHRNVYRGELLAPSEAASR